MQPRGEQRVLTRDVQSFTRQASLRISIWEEDERIQAMVHIQEAKERHRPLICFQIRRLLRSRLFQR